MTKQDLDKIWERHENEMSGIYSSPHTWPELYINAHEDRAALLAEIKRLYELIDIWGSDHPTPERLAMELYRR